MRLDAVEISHRYHGAGDQVLHDVSLGVESGEAVALVGPSGSGKTTLLAILGGLLTPTVGEVLVDGVAIPSRPDDLSMIFAWVFQTVNSLSRRTALDNVVAPLCARGESRSIAELSAHEALTRVGLSARSTARASTLSGGELQRMCIARALVGNPRFLLADEPTGQLDLQTSVTVLDSLWESRSSEVGLVIATHDSDVARRCDRVLTLMNGTLN